MAAIPKTNDQRQARSGSKDESFLKAKFEGVGKRTLLAMAGFSYLLLQFIIDTGASLI